VSIGDLRRSAPAGSDNANRLPYSSVPCFECSRASATRRSPSSSRASNCRSNSVSGASPNRSSSRRSRLMIVFIPTPTSAFEASASKAWLSSFALGVIVCCCPANRVAALTASTKAVIKCHCFVVNTDFFVRSFTASSPNPQSQPSERLPSSRESPAQG